MIPISIALINGIAYPRKAGINLHDKSSYCSHHSQRADVKQVNMTCEEGDYKSSDRLVRSLDNDHRLQPP